MRIIQELYQLCCKKRFLANPVTKIAPAPRTIVHKYLTNPDKIKRPRPPPESQMQQPGTPNYETGPRTNPFIQSQMISTDQRLPPPEIKRRTVYTEQPGRPRSDTLPFLEQPEQLQQLSSMRSGNGSTTTRRVYRPPHDEQEEEEEEQQQ